MASPNAGTLVSADWTPFLIKVPKLIHHLGVCTSLAATRQASQIELLGPDLEYKRFVKPPRIATELI